MIAIDGSYTTDLNYWVRFGSENMDDVIRNIPRICGLILSGRLSEADCKTIFSKKQSLVILDLHEATVPDGTLLEEFTRDAPMLTEFYRPTQ